MGSRALSICVVFALAPSVLVHAGDTSSLSARLYRVTHWTTDHGLPENNVKGLAQTRDGYLWVGTLSGLARFDGVSFRLFDHSNSRGMTHDAINDLAADAKDSELWIMTESGLVCFQDQKFRRYGPEQRFSGFTGQLWPARDGGVWFAPGTAQIALARGNEVKTWPIPVVDPNQFVQQVFEEPSGKLLLLLGGRVFRYGPQEALAAALELPFAGRTCSSFCLDQEQSLWVCSGADVWRSSNRGWTSGAARLPNLERVFRTSDGQLWATQHKENRSSLQWLVQGRFEDFSAAEFPPEANVTRWLEDREGNLWVGTTSGLLQIQPKRLRTYSRQDGMASDNTLAVCAGPEGAIWVGSAEGVTRIQEGKIRNLPSPEPGGDWYRVSLLLADKPGELWVGWRNGSLVRWHGGDWQAFPFPSELGTAGTLKAVQVDREGRLWLGTTRGAFCRTDSQWKTFSMTNGLSSEDVRVIHQDQRGDIWFGTYGGGLNCLHQEQITSYTTTNGDYNNRAWWIHEDHDGVFWVGTQDGLNRFVPPRRKPEAARPGPISAAAGPGADLRFFTFTTRSGLRENVVNNVQEDQFGYLWLSGLRGVYRVSRAELNDVAAGRENKVRCVVYGEADGMLSSECNGGDDQPAGCTDKAGHIWFPTAQGVVEIDPAKAVRGEVPPLVVIEDIKADGESVLRRPESNGSDPVTNFSRSPLLDIQPGKAHVLEFQYTANSFVAAERAQFRYRLFGADNEWRDAGNQRTVRYVGLRPGSYRFEVTAANHHGVWSPRPAACPLVLEPHFWQTRAFYALCIFGAVGVAALVQAYRLKWQHRLLKLEQQHALANERARIARDLHDDLGTALTGLALQLDVARREAGENVSVGKRFSETADKARELADRMREVVWTINPRCDTVSGVATFLEQQVTQFLNADGLSVKLDFPEDIPATPLGAQARHQLALSVREALTNVIRHAHATEVVVSLSMRDQALFLEVKDNGRGFEPREGAGHGLGNMRMRMEQVGGSFECASRPGAGTVLRFRLPLTPPARTGGEG